MNILILILSLTASASTPITANEMRAKMGFENSARAKDVWNTIRSKIGTGTSSVALLRSHNQCGREVKEMLEKYGFKYREPLGSNDWVLIDKGVNYDCYIVKKYGNEDMCEGCVISWGDK